MGQAFHQIFAEAEGRVIVASFASHIHRIQQAIQIAHLHGRKFAVSGRSMVKNVNVARNLGYLKVPEGAMVKLADIDEYRPDEILVLSTGSQGEPLSALSRMAFSDHPQVVLNEGDTVVISAKAIPGNELSVTDTINRLLQSGARVVHGEHSGVHVSGHASQDDLRMLLNLIRPQYLVPVHGEYRHQHIHAQLGREAGIGDERIFILENGDVLDIDADSAEVTGKVHAGMVFVDGLELGEADGAVLRDRQQLSEDGILIAVVTLSVQTGKTVRPIELVARGFLHDGETEQDVLGKAAAALEERLREAARDRVTGQTLLKQDVHDALADHVFRTLRRRPLIMPVIVEV